MVGAADRRELNAWDCFVTWGYGGLNVAALMAACPAPIFLHISGQVWLARRTKKRPFQRMLDGLYVSRSYG
jgi:hypothetical protein